MYNLRANYCNSTPAVICGIAEDKRVISQLFTPSVKLLLLHESVKKATFALVGQNKAPSPRSAGSAQTKVQTYRYEWE